jgi:uncharacterized membrane protein
VSEFFDYQTLKWIHIISATFLFGTGVGSAFYKFLADRSGNVLHIAITNRHVVLADWLFTTPTIVIQPVTGVMLAVLLGFPLTTPWLGLSLILYGFTLLCWLPVVVMQVRMARLAESAVRDGQPLGEDYRRLVHGWVALGVLAFIAMMAIYYLMVYKPALWA